MWSRWTGGDGAPGWTFDLIGMDITRLDATGAAVTHEMHGDPFPRMIWPSNSSKLGSGTLFTLFFGAPFDLDDKAAYASGDFSTQVAALDAYINAMDTHLLNYTIWNYTSDNTNERGDLWNDEDLSIFSRDQQDDPSG